MINRMPEIASQLDCNFGQLFYADGNWRSSARLSCLRIRCSKCLMLGNIRKISTNFSANTAIGKQHTTAWLKAGINPSIAEGFTMGPETPLLEWEEVYYDIYDQRIGYIKIFFHPEIMDLSLLLKF